MGLFDAAISLLHMGIDGYSVANEITEYIRKLCTTGLSVEEYKTMYELSYYDPDSKQKDIRLIKSLDKPGVYVIQNLESGQKFSEKAQYVFKKVYRTIRGYENQDIYEKIRKDGTLNIKVILLENTDTENLDELLAFVRKE